MKPAISIVTISYNKAPFIEECMRSVLEQDCPGVEYIVVDAASTDRTGSVLNRYRDRIDTLIEERDEGPADGLNKGFSRATADLFGYINADDRYVPGALRYVVRYFETHPDIDVLCGAIRMIDGSNRVSLRKRTSDRFDLADYAAGICTIAQQATFFRRSAFEAAGRFNVANRIAWDGELLVDMALAGARFASVRRVLGDFRLYEGSITRSRTYLDHLTRYNERICDKLARRKVRLYSRGEQHVRRFLYKFDVTRHLHYFLVT